MAAIRDPVTREVIASSLGAQWNDRVVQVFTTFSELQSGTYTGWAPIRGSLGYAEDVRALYEVVDFDGNGKPVWWPVGGRGAIVNNSPSDHMNSGVVILPGTGAMTNIVKLAGAVRYGRTYLFNFQCTAYTESGNLGLWSGQCFVERQSKVNYAIGALIPGGYLRLAGQGWAAGVFASSEISGTAVIGPMGANEPAANFVWRGASHKGMPDLKIVNPMLSIVEVGAGV